MKTLHRYFIGKYLDETEDLFERSRIELLYYYSLCFIVLGTYYYIALIAAGFVFQVYATTFAVISLATVPFMLKFTRSYKLVGYWYVVQQTIMAIANVFLAHGAISAIDGYWTVLFILCVLFLFGIKQGLLICVINSVVVGITTGVSMEYGLQFKEILPAHPKFLIVPLLLNTVVVILFIRFRGEAERKMNQQKVELEIKNKEVHDSISYAERIQKAILPSQRMLDYVIPGSFVVYAPKDIVSGDFYWVEKKEDISFFAVADCTGHGVPGAMMSVICVNALNRVVNEFNLKHPAEILDKLNLLVEEAFAKSGADIRDGMDVALCAINHTSGTIEYAGANNSMYYISDGALQELKADRQPIGRFESKVPFRNHTLKLKPGDFVYLFSDGIADQFGGPQGKKFKYKRVKDILLSNGSKNVYDQKNAILDAFRSWKGNLEQVDDVCVMGVKI